MVATAVASIGPSIAVAADPSPSPSPAVRLPTCAERYPADGPGGVDLQLGCVANELVGHFTGLGPSDAPERLSRYAWPIALAIVVLVALAAAIREIRRRAATRLAPAAPQAWRSCPTCHSVTPADRPSCYRCGRPLDSTAPELRTDAEAPAPQSFGRRYREPPPE